MPRKPQVVPIVDLFAGPGGLAEGFSAFSDDTVKFQVALSVEKDPAAWRTLTLRHFFRRFDRGDVPKEYYDYLRFGADDPIEEVFGAHRKHWTAALKSSLNLELGNGDHDREVYNALKDILSDRKLWVLVGGPPCQAYSIVGRSRRTFEADDKEARDAFEADQRHYLYREYLKIIQRFQPPLFVMENVKGILSSRVKGGRIFDRILDDLQSPSDALGFGKGPLYRVVPIDIMSPPVDEYCHTDFIIRAEKHGVPQRRHRVILLGIRSDIDLSRFGVLDDILPDAIVSDVVSDLPQLRSQLSREPDSPSAWHSVLKKLFEHEFADVADDRVRAVARDAVCLSAQNILTGGRYERPLGRPVMGRDLRGWLLDPELKGVVNHQARHHRRDDLMRYLFVSSFGAANGRSPRLRDFPSSMLPRHENAKISVKSRSLFEDRFRVQLANGPATTVTSHIAKDGHYFIHHDPAQCRSWTVREAARIQTFPDNYFFEGGRTQQYTQVGNAVPPLLARSIATRVAAVIKQCLL